MVSYGVPPVPTVGEELLAAYEAAHEATASAVGGLDDDLRQIALRWLLDIAEQSLASIRPTVLGTDEPPLIPPPRAFLSPLNLARIHGVRQALHHVDVRLSLLRRNLEVTLIRPETPFVLNALAEGPDSTGQEANPGMIRANQSSWEQTNNPYGHPPSAVARSLAEQAVLRAQLSGEPAVVRGAWLAFTWMSIHPFVDGNGRTARMLYLLVASSELPLGLDYAVAEQLIHERQQYVDMLRAGQKIAPSYDADIIDPRPFVEWLIGASTRANERLVARVEALVAADVALAELMPGASGRQRALCIGVWLRQPLYPDRLSAHPDADADLLAELELLVTLDALVRVATPPSRRVPGATPRASYVASEPVGATVAAAVAATMTQP